MKISIIIPVYNSEKYLASCLNSCLDQGPFVIRKDYEIICVNDGSTDGSDFILKNYESRGITVITQRNSGVSSARNTGFSHAKGDFVWFVDSDDVIRPEILPIIYDELLVSKAEGCTLKIQPVNENFQLDSFAERICLTFNNAVTNMQNACMVIAKRQYMNEHNIRFKEGMTYGEDTLFMYYMRLYEHKFINCPQILYFYRQVSNSAMHNNSTEALERRIHSAYIMLNEFSGVLTDWKPNQYTGDAMTEERYYWTVQNILFIILRLDKDKRDQIFKQLQQDGHYPYPFQLKRLFVDSRCIKAWLINGFCLFFPIKVYYKIACLIFGK